jgi:hypothetical protein
MLQFSEESPRIRIGSGFNWIWIQSVSESGSRQAKFSHKKGKKLRNFVFEELKHVGGKSKYF